MIAQYVSLIVFRYFESRRMVHPMEWQAFLDHLGTLKELKDFITVGGVVGDVSVGQAGGGNGGRGERRAR